MHGQAVKQDACRSLLARVQAVMEAESGVFIGELPVRVALCSPSSLFPFTEFSLPHEDTQVGIVGVCCSTITALPSPFLQDCVNRASDLLGSTPESMTATPLEQFSEKGEGSVPPTSLISHEGGAEEYTAVKRYYGIVSILASISAVLIAISAWIILQS